MTVIGAAPPVVSLIVYVPGARSFSEKTQLRIEYDKSYFDHEQIRSLTRNYMDLLHRTLTQ